MSWRSLNNYRPWGLLMKKNDIHVAVSGFSGLNNPHPGLPVARALREGWKGPIEIHALGYDSLMTGAWLPGSVDRLHVMPSLNDGDEAMFERVLEIHADVRLDAVIPCLDLELPVFSRIAGRLQHEGIQTLLPPPDSIFATGKLRLPLFGYKNDIRTPRTIHVLDMGDVALHAEQFGFPLMVKGTVTGAKRVGSADQARKEAEALHQKWGGGVLLQEALTGDEIVVGAVVGRTGECLGLVAMRKLGVNPDGKGVFGAVIDDPVIEDEARRILDRLEWSGPLELEFMRPHGSNQLYLLEINCRFPSWIMLSHFAGCNLPVLLLREIMGMAHPRTPVRPRPGTMFVRDVRETAVPLERVDRLKRHRSEGGMPSTAARPRRRGKQGVRVAVTGLGSNDVVNPGLGVAAALRGVGEIERLYGLGYGAFDSGLYRPAAFDSVYRLPQDNDAQALLSRLTEIHREAPFDVIIPCLDGELGRFMEIEAELEQMDIRTLLPSKEAFQRREKPNLFSPRRRHDWGGFEIPKTHPVASEQETMDATRQLGFPVVVKGPVSEAITANSAWEARAAWFELREKGITEALVQAKIDGDDFAVAAVCDRKYEALTMLTVKKLVKCDRGSTWSAVNSKQAELEDAFGAFLKHLKWCGPVEGEFIRDSVSERFYLIEVNPRFTAWISFSAALAVNHPYQAVCLALDRPFEPEPVTADLVFMRACWETDVKTRDFAAISTKGRIEHG